MGHLLKRRKRIFMAAGIVLAAVIAIAVFIKVEIYISYNSLEAEEYTISSDRINSEVKLALISDLHDHTFGEKNEELVQMLNSQGLLMQVAGYAGWNTPSNTLGTAIAQGVHFWLWADTAAHRDFLLLRYLEDAGYCSDARRYVYENMLDKLDCTYFDTRAVRGPVSEFVHARLEMFVQQYLSSIAPYVCIQDCWHPWKRMFEMGIKACFQPAE